MSFPAAIFLADNGVPGVGEKCAECGRWGCDRNVDSFLCEQISAMKKEGHFDPLAREAATFIPEVEMLLSPQSKDRVYASLFRYMMADPDSTGDKLHDAEKTFYKCKDEDRLSTLKLAVWKQVCILTALDDNMTLRECLHWCSDGWKEKRKAEMRDSREVNIIMSRVAEFVLDSYESDDESSWNTDIENERERIHLRSGEYYDDDTDSDDEDDEDEDDEEDEEENEDEEEDDDDGEEEEEDEEEGDE